MIPAKEKGMSVVYMAKRRRSAGDGRGDRKGMPQSFRNDPDLKEGLVEYHERTGAPTSEVIHRLIRWFLTQDRDTQDRDTQERVMQEGKEGGR